ncbi:MAG: PKD domain-containing protein, partial [Methanoregulaceae archaeon]|nr:PKD domain-containing protein [Methanoregulaceae archaeon]
SSFGVAPLVVQFTDQSLRNPTSWNWDFGDGEISTLQNPVHTFDTKGRYTIRLTVQNPTGQSTTAKRLYVY